MCLLRKKISLILILFVYSESGTTLESHNYFDRKFVVNAYQLWN